MTTSIAERDPALRISHVILTTGGFQESAGRFVVEVDALLGATCDPFDDSFGGTYRGIEMEVRTLGGEQIHDFFCNEPSLLVDPFAAPASANNTIEIHDATGSRSVTFADGELEPRVATAPSFDLRNGEPLVVAWSHPQDLIAEQPRLAFRETYPDISECLQGCNPLELDFPGTVDGNQITFTPQIPRAASGEIFIRVPGVFDAEITECNARDCDVFFSHGFLHSSTIRP